MIDIDLIGPLFDPPLVEGGEPVEMAGWHVNVTPAVLAMRSDLEPFIVTPTRLRRVWAGDDPVEPVLTVALRFIDENAAIGAGLDAA